MLDIIPLKHLFKSQYTFDTINESTYSICMLDKHMTAMTTTTTTTTTTWTLTGSGRLDWRGGGL